MDRVHIFDNFTTSPANRNEKNTISFSLYDDQKTSFLVTAPGFGEASAFSGSINADNSGVLDDYKGVDQNNIIEKYEWDQDGNGKWWAYNNGIEWS